MGLTEGLRNFTQVDNHRALEIGHLREGLRSFKVRRPIGEEGACQGKPRRIDAKSRGNVHLEVVHQCRPHCKREVRSSWWMLIGTPSAKRCTKASKEKTMTLTKK